MEEEGSGWFSSLCTVKKQTERSRPFMAACNYVHPSRFRIAGLKIGEGST